MTMSRTLWRSVTAIDRSRLRRWSAVRRGLLVLLAFAVGSLVADPETGALASVASLFVGLQERNAAASYTSRVMLVQSVFYAGLVLVVGWLSYLPLVSALLLTLVAGAAGLAAYNDKAMSRMFGDSMAVAAFLGVSAILPREAPGMALAVLLGGLSQALLALVSVRVESDLMERRPVAAALLAVADHLDDALTREHRSTGQTAEERLLAASDLLSASDLVGDRRRQLRRLLTDAELLRQEATAVRARRALQRPVGDEQRLSAALANASRTLRALATALTSVPIPGRFDRKGEAALASLYDRRLEAEALEADRDADLTARAVAHLTARLYRHTAALVSTTPARDRGRRRRVGQGMARYLFRPTRRDRAVGIRLASATVAAFVVATALDLPHGAWVASTTVSLLRPDWRPLTADTLGRAAGTAGASALAIPLVLATGNTPWVDLALVFAMSVATFVIAAANEGLYVLTTSMVTVFTRAVVGENAVAAATSRVLDVVVGAIIAAVFLAVIPVGHGRRLARDLADYADATADWLEAVSVLAAGTNPPHEKRLRRAMRSARVRVQHGIEMRIAEPMGPGLSARRAEAVFDQVHTAARAAAAAERALKHGERAGPEAVPGVQDAVSTLHDVADRLRRFAPGTGRTALPEPPPDTAGEVAVLLAHCDRSAHQALVVLGAPHPAAASGGPAS